jgi:hypothetical protein
MLACRTGVCCFWRRRGGQKAQDWSHMLPVRWGHQSFATTYDLPNPRPAVRNSGCEILTTTSLPRVRRTTPSNTNRNFVSLRSLAGQAMEIRSLILTCRALSAWKAIPELLISCTHPLPLTTVPFPRASYLRSAFSGKRNRRLRSFPVEVPWCLATALSPLLLPAGAATAKPCMGRATTNAKRIAPIGEMLRG